MANKIQIKRGLASGLPVLDAGEFGFSEDSKQVHIGDGVTNFEIVKIGDSPTFAGVALTSLTASANLDIGAFSFRADQLITDRIGIGTLNPAFDIHGVGGEFSFALQAVGGLGRTWVIRSTAGGDYEIISGDIVRVHVDIGGNMIITGKTRTTRLEVDDALTYMDRDANGNLTLTDAVTGTMTLAEMSCPPLVTLSAVTQVEGNLSLTGFKNRVLIKWIRIKTASTDWNLTLFKKNTFLAADAFQVVNGRNGDYDIYLDYPYSDENGTPQLHINFTDVTGANTYDIEVRGFALR